MNNATVPRRRLTVMSLGAAVTLSLLGLIFVVIRKPLWYDELFTLSVAAQPGVSGVIRALLQGADNHAPLDYIIRHFALMLPGPTEVVFRLPSVAAFTLFCACMFVFVRRRAGYIEAWTAFLIPFATVAIKHAPEARAYPIVLACTGMAMLAWQMIGTARSKLLNAAIIAITLGAAVNLHYYAVLLYPAFFAAELYRSWSFRSASTESVLAKPGPTLWWTLGAMACSLPALGFVYPFARAASVYSSNFWTPLGISALPQVYGSLLAGATLLVLATAAVLAVARPGSSDSCAQDTRFITSDMFLAVCLLATVSLSYVIAVLKTRAFTDRYTLFAVGGLSVLLPLITTHHGVSRIGRQLLLLATIVMAALNFTYRSLPVSWWNGSLEDMKVRLKSALDYSNDPVVWGDTMECLAMAHYFPEVAGKRLFCLVGPAERNSTNRAVAGLAPWTTLPIHKESEFFNRNAAFLVVLPGTFARTSEFCKPTRNLLPTLNAVHCVVPGIDDSRTR